MFSAKRIYLLLLLLPFFAGAQTNDPVFDRFEELMRRMDEQMRRGMPFDTSFEGGHFQFSPDSNAYFYFYVDTSFNGMDGQFFEFSPFGDPNREDLFGFDHMFDQFFRGMTPFGPQAGPNDLPADDGELSNDDGLLPEERLRQEEEKAKSGEKKERPAKRPVKTIRI